MRAARGDAVSVQPTMSCAIVPRAASNACATDAVSVALAGTAWVNVREATMAWSVACSSLALISIVAAGTPAPA